MKQQLEAFFRKHLPDFTKLLSYERLSGGASQATYRIVVETKRGEKKFAFRHASDQPSRFDKIDSTQEAQLMEIAHAHAIPEPQVLAICAPEDGLGAGFVMTWLEGETLGKRIVNAPELSAVRPQLAFQCGEILARIHSISLARISHLQLSTQTARQALDESYQAYRYFNVPRPMVDYTARWLDAHLVESATHTLIHNDFRNGNLMVSPAGIVAVLDWELACISDPMRDLGWLCANCWRFGGGLPVGGFGAYEALFEGYRAAGGSVDPQRVKFWEVFASFRWGIICLGMAQAWQSGADRSVERSAIGRRASEGELDCANLLFADKPRIPPPQEEAASNIDDGNMPTQMELIEAVRDHLLAERKSARSTREGFLALVSANALDIVARQLKMSAAHEIVERAALNKILGGEDNDIIQQRWRLIEKLRGRQIPLDDADVINYLYHQTIRHVLIDQPNYSGLKIALEQ